jgi:hypothetical protein
MNVAKIKGLPRLHIKRYTIDADNAGLMTPDLQGNWIEYTEDLEFRLKLSVMALGAFTEAMEKQCYDSLTAKNLKAHERKNKNV